MTSFEVDFGVIKEARRRQRRRWVGVALLGAVVAAAVVVIVPRTVTPASPAPSSTFAAPGHVFSRAPYMGVACPVANSIACDRIGLAIWLRRPAMAVTATIAGAPLKLNWAGDRSPGYALRHDRTPRTAFDGFLQPAGIVARLHVIPESMKHRWLGGNAPSPLVRLRIDYGHGDVVLTQEPVVLAAGWG